MVKTLLLVDGAAGAGKTDLVEYVRSKHSGGNAVTIVTKCTTRERRPEEIRQDSPLDLDFVTPEQFAALVRRHEFYCYEYAGKKYGIKKQDIDSALRVYQNVFIIVRDRNAIRRLVADYPRVRTVPVFVYADRQRIVARLKKDGYDKSAIRFRLARTDLVWSDYLKHSGIYQDVLINNSSKTDFHRLIDSLLHKYSPQNEPSDELVVSPCEAYPLLTELVGFKAAMQARLADFDRNVFLMMKFRDSNALVYEYVRELLRASGFNCVRADQVTWNITQNVYNPLAVLYCCRYGIALFDEPEDGNSFSPNVAYELSMMHLQRKRCLILRNETLPSMPFDLIKDLHRPYSKDLELREIIRQWVEEIKADRHALEQPTSTTRSDP